MTIFVKKAVYLKEYKIKILFSDETEQILNFKNFLYTAKNPMTRKYLNIDLFKKFNIKHGDLEGNNYELCFPIWDLHENKII